MPEHHYQYVERIKRYFQSQQPGQVFFIKDLSQEPEKFIRAVMQLIDEEGLEVEFNNKMDKIRITEKFIKHQTVLLPDAIQKEIETIHSVQDTKGVRGVSPRRNTKQKVVK